MLKKLLFFSSHHLLTWPTGPAANSQGNCLCWTGICHICRFESQSKEIRRTTHQRTGFFLGDKAVSVTPFRPQPSLTRGLHLPRSPSPAVSQDRSNTIRPLRLLDYWPAILAAGSLRPCRQRSAASHDQSCQATNTIATKPKYEHSSTPLWFDWLVVLPRIWRFSL